MRWDLDNGVCLCSEHHKLGKKSAHTDPEWFRGEMIDRRGHKWMNTLIYRSRPDNIYKGTYQRVRDYLDNKIEHYL